MTTAALICSIVALVGGTAGLVISLQARRAATAAGGEAKATAQTVEGLGIADHVVAALQDGIDIRNHSEPPT